MKKLLLLLILLAFVFQVYSENIQIKVIEKKRIVDDKIDGNWKNISVGDEVKSGTEFFTGIYAQITLEIGKGSYLTINQLSSVILGETKEKNNDLITDLNLLSGSLVLYADKMDSYKNKIMINFKEGNVIFQEKSGGEIYLRKDLGVLVKTFEGTAIINPKNKTFYFIQKNEMFGITPGGILIENDYFLKRAINIKPNTITNQSQIEADYNFLFQPYSSNMNSNDYRDSRTP